MRFHKLDLNLLVALDALLTEVSISRAADRLHLSQSAMSNALARLRTYFEDPLLVQVGRRMEVTPRAGALRDAVRDVLVRVETTLAAQPEFDPLLADRELRILASDYTMATLMPHVVALVYAQAPKLRLRLLPQVEDPQQALERNEADLLVFPKAYCSPGHPTESLWFEEFVCLVCERSVHARRPLTFERYLEAAHVVMQPPQAQASFESWFLQRYGVTRRVEITTYNFGAVPPLLVDTDRVATVHRRLAVIAGRSLPLTMLPTPVQMPTMEQSLQWHKYRSQDPALVWLRALMRRAVERMDRELVPGGAPTPAG